MIGVYRQKLIEGMIAGNGGQCSYCKVEVRLNWMEYEKHDNDATVDHIIPKARGGKNSHSNYALACRRCNHAKGDRSVAEFLADPRSPEARAAEARKLRARSIRFVPIPEDTKRGEQLIRVTYRRATRAGPILSLPRGATLPPEVKPVPAYAHSAYRPPQKLTGLELARLLRKQYGPWPLA